MTDYTELVKALRCCATMTCKGDECKYMILGCHDCFPKLHDDAAAAIEALQAEVKRLELDNEDYEYTLRERYNETITLEQAIDRLYELGWLQEHDRILSEPKRGKWIIDGAFTYNLRELNGKAYEPVYRCSRCNRQTESYVRLDEPKMPEDADFPEFCPHCGAKMEVQDGQ